MRGGVFQGTPPNKHSPPPMRRSRRKYCAHRTQVRRRANLRSDVCFKCFAERTRFYDTICTEVRSKAHLQTNNAQLQCAQVFANTVHIARRCVAKRTSETVYASVNEEFRGKLWVCVGRTLAQACASPLKTAPPMHTSIRKYNPPGYDTGSPCLLQRSRRRRHGASMSLD